MRRSTTRGSATACSAASPTGSSAARASVAKPRLDVVLVDRGLAPSRERARALILAGQVTIDGQVVSKAGAPVKPDARVELAVPDHPYVGRGGLKLAGALDAFAVDPRGRRALAVGASTRRVPHGLLQ